MARRNEDCVPLVSGLFYTDGRKFGFTLFDEFLLFQMFLGLEVEQFVIFMHRQFQPEAMLHA